MNTLQFITINMICMFLRYITVWIVTNLGSILQGTQSEFESGSTLKPFESGGESGLESIESAK